MDHIYELINLNYYIKQGLQFFPRSNTFLSWTTCIGNSNNDWSMTSLPHFCCFFSFRKRTKRKFLMTQKVHWVPWHLPSWSFWEFRSVRVVTSCHITPLLIECRKTKTKFSTLANHNAQRMQLGKPVRTSHDWSGFTSDWMIKWREFLSHNVKRKWMRTCSKTFSWKKIQFSFVWLHRI